MLVPEGVAEGVEGATGVAARSTQCDSSAHLFVTWPFASSSAVAAAAWLCGRLTCTQLFPAAPSAPPCRAQALPFREHLLGVGLDSAEKGFPPSLFTDVFEEAGKHGLRRMAHAGGRVAVEGRHSCRALRWPAPAP